MIIKTIYPKRTDEDYDAYKPKIIISYDNQNFEQQEYCGYSWCTGQCGLPALVLKYENKEYKAYSNMVASGSVFQIFRVKWTGEKVYVPESAGDPKHLLEKYWR